VQLLWQVQQLLPLALHQFAHRDARPLGDDLGDVGLCDLLLEQALAARPLGQGGLRLLQLALEGHEGAVLELRRPVWRREREG
jgi:hypothetical protein